MDVVTDLANAPWPGRRAVITIGAYDGVHLGHRAVIEHVKGHAAEHGAVSAVVTFDRHPASVVRPDSAPRLLTDADQKLELLADTGVDACVVVPFTADQASETAESFVSRVLVDGLATKLVVVGDDFHFGKDRAGNVDLLRKIGAEADFGVEPLDLLPRADGVDEPISSTAIRRALAGGDIGRANEMLGRMFEVRGPVMKGDQRGRLLGFPTANVQVPPDTCFPADGVYAGWYERADGTVHPSAINVGRRPTFYEHADAPSAEAHIIDFDGDLYGEPAKVRFAHFLRSERKFDGVDALIAQLATDVERSRELLAG
ncbi:MAG: bifunctional riboflavin kinase/FAD synthetase [Actinomycetota bacterium]